MVCPNCHREIEREVNIGIDVFLKDKDGSYSEFGGSMIQCEKCNFKFILVPFSNLEEETYDFLVDMFVRRKI